MPLNPISPSQPSGDFYVNSRNMTLYPGSQLVPGWVLLSESTQIRVKTYFLVSVFLDFTTHVDYYLLPVMSVGPRLQNCPSITWTSSGEFPCFLLPHISLTSSPQEGKSMKASESPVIRILSYLIPVNATERQNGDKSERQEKYIRISS